MYTISEDSSMAASVSHNDTGSPKESSNSTTVITPLFAIYFVSVDIVLIVTTLLFVLTIAATLLAKPVNSVLRLLIINQLVACVVFLASPLQWQSGSVVLTLLVGEARAARVPPLPYCQFMSVLLGFGACGRSWSVAAFALFVLVITVRGKKKVSNTHAVLSIASVWAISLAVCAYTFVPYPRYKVYPVQYYGGVICGPSGDGISRVALLSAVLLWISLAALLPLAVAVVVPVVTLCYIRLRTVSGEQDYYNRRIAKLSLFLVLGTAINLVARAVPIVVLAISNHVATYIIVGLTISLSPLPTLIIVLWFVKSAREKLIWMVTCGHRVGCYIKLPLFSHKDDYPAKIPPVQSSLSSSNC